MKFDRKNVNRLFRLLFLLIPPAFALRIYTYWAEIDPKTGFFVRNGAACVVFNALCFLVFLLCLVLAQSKGGDINTRKEKEKPALTQEDFDQNELLVRNQEQEEEEDYPEFFLQGIARQSAVWSGTRTAFAHFLPGFFFFFFFLSFFSDTEQLKNPLTLAQALLSLLSAAYFLSGAINNSPEIRKGRAFFALTPALWCTVRMIAEYRDIARFVNKTMYASSFFFLLSATVFFVYQAQLLLGEKTTDRPNAYAFSALAVAFFGLVVRMPHLLAMMSVRVPMDMTDAACVLMDLVIAFYALVKVRAAMKKDA